MVIPFKRCSPSAGASTWTGYLELPIFLLVTFAGALLAGLSGFLYARFRPALKPVTSGGSRRVWD
jgi:hypothetical protein